MTDAESFHEYARPRLPVPARVAYLLTGDPFLADDLVQLTLPRLASRWEQVSAARAGRVRAPDPLQRARPGMRWRGCG